MKYEYKYAKGYSSLTSSTVLKLSILINNLETQQ